MRYFKPSSCGDLLQRQQHTNAAWQALRPPPFPPSGLGVPFPGTGDVTVGKSEQHS